jgi:thiol-disulfide isomerase/thioredoxin
MDFIKKNLSNILFFGFIIFLFTPYGLPVRATLIKGVSFVTTRVLNMEIDKDEQKQLQTYNWELSGLKGETVDFNEFKGQVVLVNFWATWCPPCIAEMPSYQDLYNDYKDKMVFVFVANDDPKKVKKFIADKGYQLPVFLQITKAPDELLSNSLPTTFIIDKTGKIVVDKTGAADWNSGKVKKMLDKLISN